MQSPVLEALKATLSQLAPRRLVVAFSGGRDSTVLLHGLVSLAPRGEVGALHVNHAMQPDADAWQRHCESICRDWGVPLKTVGVHVVSGPGAEQRAREARYAALAEHTCAGDCVLLAHHLDDQVETMLLRLMRGGATLGLAGMPRRRPLGGGELVRPLLDVTGAEILAHARAFDLSWVNDPSNESEHFDRNYLRHRVLPLLEQRWPGYRRVMARNSALMVEAAALMSEIADADMHARLGPDGALAIADLEGLSDLRQQNLLRGWLGVHGVQTPSRNRLRELVRQSGSRRDGQPCVRFGEVEIRRFRDALYVTRPYADHEAEPLRWQPPQRAAWCGGTLWARPVVGRGLRHDAALEFEVRRRHGGERLRPSGGRTRELKHVLQEARVPPWLRGRLPLVFAGETLVAVAGVCVGEGWQAREGEPGWEICWHAD